MKNDRSHTSTFEGDLCWLFLLTGTHLTTVDGSEIRRKPTRDGAKTSVNNGTNYQPQLVNRISCINSINFPWLLKHGYATSSAEGCDCGDMDSLRADQSLAFFRT